MRHRLLLLVLLGSACAARERSAVETDSPVALARRGERVFRDHCNACHPGGGKGLGPAIERSLDRASLVGQIRQGIGQMPAFTPATLADGDVEAVLAYVDGLVSRARKARSEELARASGEAASSVVRMVDSLRWDDTRP